MFGIMKNCFLRFVLLECSFEKRTIRSYKLINQLLKKKFI